MADTKFVEQVHQAYLRATVSAKVIVPANAGLVSDDSSLEISLKIECENRTSEPLVMDERYRLPVKNTADCKAWDNTGELTALHDDNYVEVEFLSGDRKQHPVILPGKSYHWELSFKTRGRFESLEKEDVLIGPYVISPIHIYKNIFVEYHKFDYEFSFIKPGPRWKWPLKENFVAQTNNKNFSSKNFRRWDRTDCKFSIFSLRRAADGRDERLRINFARVYRYNSWIFASSSFISGALIAEVAKRIFTLAMKILYAQ
jgi:hypothetical protein